MSASWIDALAARASLPPELVAWARTQPDLQTAWSSCDRLDWMIDFGAARATDDTLQRALTYAGCSLFSTDPWIFRLRPAGVRVARAWATRGTVADLDSKDPRQGEDWQNACVIVLPIAVALLGLYQYGLHASPTTLKVIGALTMPAVYLFARLWGRTRVRLTERAIAEYRFERVESDVLSEGRRLARTLPPLGHQALIQKFRNAWRLRAALPAREVSGAAS